MLSLLQVAVFTNMFTILNNAGATQQVQQLVVDLLSDVRLEVQQMASTVLSGLIHCKFIHAEEKLLVSEFACTPVKAQAVKIVLFFKDVDLQSQETDDSIYCTDIFFHIVVAQICP